MTTGADQQPAVRFTVHKGVACLALNRPDKRNAINAAMRVELAAALRQARSDRSIKVLILRGEGGAFCAGGDISGMAGPRQADDIRERLLELQGIVTDLLMLDRPVIAAVDGPAFGAGLGLALACDLIVASSGARFCASFLRLGAIPDCAVLYTLPRLVGGAVAKQLVFSTREFGAQEALAMGIVSEIVEPAVLHARAHELANALCALPSAALSITKRALGVSPDSDLATMLELEAAGQGIAQSSTFHAAAVEGFLRKEPPAFRWPGTGD